MKAILDSVKDPLTDDWDPILLSLLWAKLEYEDLNIEKEMETFNQLVATAKKNFRQDSLNFKDQLSYVISSFKNDFGFQGDKTNYYNIKNSFMNDVLVRRKGIPITLSLVFMGICRSLGLKAVGISFPGHFLVRVIPSLGHFDRASAKETMADWKTQSFIDCFDGGQLMTVQDCEKRLFEWTRGVVPFGPEVLKVAHPGEILSRMLRNLRAIFMEKEDLARLYWVLTSLIELCPADRLESYKDRGILMGRTGRFSAACDDFRLFLASSEDPQKRAHVEQMLRFFENQTELPN
jgi:regulator of sirC expression with transglutaminase-like and TPR domain